MYKPLPFVKRFMRLSPRRQGYSTALSTKYWDWSGLRDNHGQHTILLLVYSWTQRIITYKTNETNESKSKHSYLMGKSL